MDRIWQLLRVCIVVSLLSACRPASDIVTATPTSATSTSDSAQTTSTILPFSQPAATSTALPPTQPPTPVPSATSTPMPMPPTSTPAPFLPQELPLIEAGNIHRLHVIATLPIKEIYELTFSPSGKKLATLSEPPDDRFNDYMEVWDLSSGTRILQVDKWDSPHSLFFTPDENALYVHDRLYDLTSGQILSTLQVVPSAYSPDGLTYAMGDYQGDPDQSLLQIIDVATQQVTFERSQPGMVMFLDFSPDGRLLTGGFQVVNNFVVKAWEVASGTEVIDLINYYSGLHFSPDSSLAATVKGDQVYLFSAKKMTYLASYGFSDPYTHPMVRDFSHKGDILAIEDRYIIRFLVPETGKELLSLPDECEVKFSPQGSILVTWCSQSDLKIWGVKE